MARIFKHTDLEDSFVEFDCRDLSRVDAGAVCRAYEAGKVALLQGLRIDCDRQFLAGVEFPSEPKPLKKFASHRFLRETGGGEGGLLRGLARALLQRAAPRTPVAEQVLARVFANDRGRFRRFTEQVRHVNAQILHVCRTLFPGYRRIHESITWRFSETVNENLHVDVYEQDLPDHHLRLFVNMDSAPRLWNVSWTLEQLLRDHLGRLDPEFVRSATPGRICHALNFLVFGRMAEAGRDGQPRHVALFEPGEVWLVDSRKVSHQIVYGRRAISTDFAIETGSMADPRQHYYELVERYRRPAAAAAP